MSRITDCPKCQTRFRVSETQLQMRHGKVRCGRCSHIFNALESLVEEASPSLETPPEPEQALAEEAASLPLPRETVIPQHIIPPQETPKAVHETEAVEFDLDITHPEEPVHADEALFELEVTASVVPAEPEEPLFDLDITSPETPFDAEARELKAHAESNPPQPLSSPLAAMGRNDALTPPDDTSGPSASPEPENKQEARVVRIQPPPTPIQPKVSPDRPKYAPPPKPRRAWPWAAANLLLFVALTSQGIYFYRDDIAALYPPTRPLLEEACHLLACKVDLPRNSDLISIESSELHADPSRANIVVLTSILRNRAPHVQAYPMLELTLTNTEDEMVARMLLPPRDYLKATTSIQQGIAANGEVAVKLLMDLGNLKSEGYRLYLFYPS
jgi:predicted Zn finger-like uncharacterized protein